MATLWQIEEIVRGQSPEARVAARQQTSAAVVAELFALWQKTLPRVSGKSKLAEALRYAISRRAMFELTDGRIELDSNIVELAIRPQAGPESLCSPSLSVCKHWKRLRISNATRAALSGYRSLDRRRSQVAGPDLIRRAGNHLLGRQHVRLDKVAYSVVRHAQSRRRLCHGKPFALFIG